MDRELTFLMLIAGVILLLAMSGTAAAEVSVTPETEYNGGEEGSTQVIEVEATVTPEGNEITDVRIEVDQTGNSFVDFDTFDLSVNPAGVEERVSTVGDGAFEISRLDVGEEVTISYEVYPREIKSEALEVSTVSVDYVQRGQDLSETQPVEADLSTSPWFRLVSARQTVNDLQRYFWIGVGGVIIGLIGIIVGAVGIHKSREDEEDGPL